VGGPSVETIQCPCGMAYADTRGLKRVGWTEAGEGSAMLLANCTSCRSTITIEVMADASICTACNRLVTGCEGDAKTVVGDEVLCLACTVRTFLVPSFARDATPAQPPRAPARERKARAARKPTRRRRS
jgi:hypothetical protein